MQNLKAALLFDAGISPGMAYFGVFYGFLALIAIIFLEAKVMRDRFQEVSYWTSVKYSAILNIASAVTGMPLMFLVLNGTPQLGELAMFFSLAVFAPYYLPGTVLWILLAFVITISVELIGLILLLNPRPDWRKALRFSFVANIRSYLVLFLTPMAIQFIAVFIIFLINPPG